MTSDDKTSLGLWLGQLNIYYSFITSNEKYT